MYKQQTHKLITHCCLKLVEHFAISFAICLYRRDSRSPLSSQQLLFLTPVAFHDASIWMAQHSTFRVLLCFYKSRMNCLQSKDLSHYSRLYTTIAVFLSATGFAWVQSSSECIRNIFPVLGLPANLNNVYCPVLTNIFSGDRQQGTKLLYLELLLCLLYYMHL